MHDQADQLRKLVRDAVERHGALAPGAPLVAVAAAQRHVGATTIACGLARQLARLGKQVILIDANHASPAIARLFNARPRGTLAEVLAGHRRAIEVLTPTDENIRILAGADELDPAQLQPAAFQSLHAELSALARHADVLLLDVGVGMNPWLNRFWLLAQRVLLATTPNPAAMLDAYAAVKLAEFDRLDGRVQLVVTRCDDPADAARLQTGFSATCQQFLGIGVRPAAVLPSPAADDDADYARSLRLLAADMACDFRALAARMPARRGCRLSALGHQPERAHLPLWPTADRR